MEYSMYVSFMEIYNENAYDLLDKNNIEKKLESWDKVYFWIKWIIYLDCILIRWLWFYSFKKSFS